ncbi:MAG: tRNA (adenosine(37)-N6)-threonylcarbamoyltransferase complex dimerization subunit type 1 TsaB [Acidimicrobiales bacterium]|nr:tRNA (adenosine(37)-N6)-threonylcarbamoyltransferase complex dimerization subunit type 1 TsaB [Acidimicrobiales bacterium]
MLILGIDTATPQVGCAIGGHEGVLARFESARGQQHTETLTPAIDFVRRRARVELADISVVAVDVGPGLFTGLRVGVATGKAIAHALRVPMIGISSLDLLALPVRYTSRLIVAVVDARRGELFYAFYRQVPGGVQRVVEPQIGSPEDLASDLGALDDEILLVGDGALRYADHLARRAKTELADRGLAYPSAASLVQLAHPKALREEFVNPWDLQPLYLRRPDAEINWKVREGR